MLQLDALLPPRTSPGHVYFASRSQVQTAKKNSKDKGKQRARQDDEDELDDSAIFGKDGAPALLEKLRALSRKKRGDSTEAPRSILHFETPPIDCSVEEPHDNVVEELTWQGSTLVWSKGSSVYRTYSYADAELADHAIQQALFACFEVPSAPSHYTPSNPFPSPVASTSTSTSTFPTSDSSLFGPFHPPAPPAWSDDNANASATKAASSTLTSAIRVRVLCVLFQEAIYLYYPNGEHHIVPLHFVVKKAWALERGLLLERDPETRTLASCNPSWLGGRADSQRRVSEPSFATLLDPFEEIRPIAKAASLVNIPLNPAFQDLQEARKSTSCIGKISPFIDPHERIIFTTSSRKDGSEPLLVSVNDKTGKMSIWAYGQIVQDPKKVYDRFKRRVLEQELAELDAVGDVTSGTMRGEEQMRGTYPAGAGLGKRRRSADSAIDGGAPSSDPLGPPSSSAGGNGGPSAAQRRVSSLLDRRKSNINPNASVADFLEMMGTDTNVNVPGIQAEPPIPHGRERAMRRTSTAISSSTYMDRRHSTARNELSISLNRMALGGRALSIGGGGGGNAGGGAAVAAAVEAMMHTDDGIQLGHGHGEMERETSFMIDGHREMEGSDMYMARLHSDILYDVGPGTFDDAEATVFDVRGSASLLGILIPSTKTLYLFRISRSVAPSTADGPTASKIVCTPLRQLECVAIAGVYSTRHAQQDLLTVDSAGSLSLLTADSQAIPLDLSEAHADKKIVGLERASNTAVQLTMEAPDGGQTKHRVSMDFRTRSLATSEALKTLAAVLPLKQFIEVLQAYLAIKGGTTAMGDMDALCRTLLPGQKPQPAPAPMSDWEALLADCPAGAISSTANTAYGPPIAPQHLEMALFSLRTLSEEWKLLIRRQSDVLLLASLLSRLASHLGLLDYLDASFRDGASLTGPAQDVPAGYTRRIPPPFDVHAALRIRLLRVESASPCRQLEELMTTSGVAASNYYGSRTTYPVLRQVLQIYDLWHSPPPHASGEISGQTPAERVVLHCASLGWSTDDLAELAIGPALPIREAIRQCQLKTPELWPRAAYALLHRTDQLVMTTGPPIGRKREPTTIKKRIQYTLDTICDTSRNAKPISHPQHQLKRKVKDKAARFSQDSRLQDVHRMLTYTVTRIVKLPSGADTSEAALAAVLQKFLTGLAYRTLSLPFGNAAFDYRALARPRSAGISIPKVELSAKILPQPSITHLSSDSLGPDQRTWPYFHSGVAVALHIAWGKDDFDASEYAFHKPSELNARHAGLLLGLGLTGQIRSLGTYQAFKYMDPKHEYSSVGLLLGLGAAYMGTGDPKITSALSVHVSALHPPTAAPLNVSLTIQSAGLVGLGLLHIGSRNRKIADNILRDMTRICLLGTEHPDSCREGYALASAFSYGIVMLGRGDEDYGPGDSDMLRTFRYLLEGGRTAHLPGARKVFEGTLDVSITAPAAGAALALTFLRTNRKDVADMLEIPQSIDRLDHVRSEVILTRTVARSLIMWDSISCKQEWVESLVPAFVLASIARKEKTGQALPYDQELAYWNTVAGACLAMGLKYAGTAKEEAHSTLIYYLDRLIRVTASSTVTASLRSKLSKHGLQACVNTVVLAFASVMAGTGELNLLRRLRVMHGQTSETITYGTHMASHLALGLLFLGKGRYTLGTSKQATAALFCAFYPVFPTTPACNRFHLQAFRHLWVLAVEPRCLVAKDIDSGKSIYIPLKFRVKEQDETGSLQTRSKKLTTPTLIPPLHTIESIRTDSPRYWPVTLNFASSKEHLDSFLRNQTIFVKRRSGHLSYAHDARGIRSVFTQAKVEAGSNVLDDGETAQLLAMSTEHLSSFISTYTAISSLAKADMRYFSSQTEPDLQSTKQVSNFLASVVMECLIQDKHDAIPIYRALYSASRSAMNSPYAVQAFREVLFVTSLYRDGLLENLLQASGGRRLPLINRSFIDKLSLQLESSTERAISEPDAMLALGRYLSPSTVSSTPTGDTLRPVLATMQIPPRSILLQLRDLVRQARAKYTGTEEGFKLLMAAVLEKALNAVARAAGNNRVDERLVELLLSASART